MNQTSKRLIAVVLLLVAGAVGYLWMQPKPVPETALAPPSVPATVLPPSSTPAPVDTPAIRHPIEAIAPANSGSSAPETQAIQADPKSEVTRALIDLLGQKYVLAFLSSGDFIHQFVTTVDNLGRDHAPSLLWPVQPTPGRTLVIKRNGGIYLDPANAARYSPFVQLAASVDPNKAAAIYARLYPLFQQAYKDLGYPGKYFNDRLVDVIDQLLETPELTQPIELTLTQVNGPIPSLRPWDRYEFADPTLEARPAGQKILLRMGLSNALLIKTQLYEFRALIAADLKKSNLTH